ncbi:MAG: hypothetical protein GDA54_06730 [Alphaproteobacteria bacterium GM7ARS4]|nr:hypothetical protein [Alphaproteobacteria bacterium GM7ARS4]
MVMCRVCCPHRPPHKEGELRPSLYMDGQEGKKKHLHTYALCVIVIAHGTPAWHAPAWHAPAWHAYVDMRILSRAVWQ